MLTNLSSEWKVGNTICIAHEQFLLYEKKSLNLRLLMFLKFVLWSQTNKDKSTEIVPPHLLTPPYLCAYAICMMGALKGQKKAQFLKKTTELCPYRSSYSMLYRRARCWCTQWSWAAACWAWPWLLHSPTSNNFLFNLSFKMLLFSSGLFIHGQNICMYLLA